MTKMRSMRNRTVKPLEAAEIFDTQLGLKRKWRFCYRDLEEVNCWLGTINRRTMKDEGAVSGYVAAANIPFTQSGSGVPAIRLCGILPR
jgi:hypothetical protein